MVMWSHIENGTENAVNKINSHVSSLVNTGKASLPDLSHGNTLYLFSDYNVNTGRRLISYSFLLIDKISFISFVLAQRRFWKNHALGVNLIDYNGLNDETRSKALIPFLQLANKLNGLLFTVILDNRKKNHRDEMPGYLEDQITAWKTRTLQEKFLQYRELVIWILSRFASKTQNVLWVTANDDLVGTELQLKIANNIMKETLFEYMEFDRSRVELKSLASDTHDRCYEKLCCLADLAGSSTINYLRDYGDDRMFPGPGEIITASDLKFKSHPVTSWLSGNEEKNALKKITIIHNCSQPLRQASTFLRPAQPSFHL